MVLTISLLNFSVCLIFYIQSGALPLLWIRQKAKILTNVIPSVNIFSCISLLEVLIFQPATVKLTLGSLFSSFNFDISTEQRVQFSFPTNMTQASPTSMLSLFRKYGPPLSITKKILFVQFNTYFESFIQQWVSFFWNALGLVHQIFQPF